MAKVKQQEEVIALSEEAVNTSPIVVEAESKVRVRILKDVDCTIHDTSYQFKAGVDATVPPMVSCILINGGKATRI
jgi:hypothetical protein